MYRISSDCIACGTCLAECPIGCIAEGAIYSIDEDACVECAACTNVCPVDAVIEA